MGDVKSVYFGEGLLKKIDDEAKKRRMKRNEFIRFVFSQFFVVLENDPSEEIARMEKYVQDYTEDEIRDIVKELVFQKGGVWKDIVEELENYAGFNAEELLADLEFKCCIFVDEQFGLLRWNLDPARYFSHSCEIYEKYAQMGKIEKIPPRWREHFNLK